MHIGFIGTMEHRKGCGKTYALVHRMKKAFDSGKKIYSNIHLNFPYEPIYPESLLMKIDYANCFIGVDEIPNWFNSLQSGFQLILLSAIINQTRKRKVDFGWTAQRIKDVSVRIRDDATIYVCYKWHTDFERCVDQEDICKENHFITLHERFDENHLILRNGIKIINGLIKMYDTNQIIPVHLLDSKKLKQLFLEKQKEVLNA